MSSPLRAALLGAALVAAVVSMAPPAAAYDRDSPSIITKTPTIGRRGLYLVQPDDTLWELCEIFFGEPWYWPNLWSYNPQITNPHWIFPGDLLQIRRPQPPSRTTLIWSDSRYTGRKPHLEILSRYVGYLPDRPFKASGQIKHARETHNTLGEFDEVYVEFSVDTVVRVGERFTIYRYDGPIHHPRDEDVLIGHKIRHLGIGKVLSADTRYVKALIIKSYEEIERGDLVTSAFPHSWVVKPVINEVDTEATLIEAQDPIVFAGQYHYVYLDKGRNDGVKRGNRFQIRRRGDGAWLGRQPEEDVLPNFPWETYGEVMVVESFEETSLGIVSRAIREVVRGDKLIMEKGY